MAAPARLCTPGLECLAPQGNRNAPPPRRHPLEHQPPRDCSPRSWAPRSGSSSASSPSSPTTSLSCAGSVRCSAMRRALCRAAARPSLPAVAPREPPPARRPVSSRPRPCTPRRLRQATLATGHGAPPRLARRRRGPRRATSRAAAPASTPKSPWTTATAGRPLARWAQWGTGRRTGRRMRRAKSRSSSPITESAPAWGISAR